VGDCSLVYTDVVVITEIKELLSGEIGATIDDDRVRKPKAGNNVLQKTNRLLGADFSQGPCLDPLSELVDYDTWVGQASEGFLEGSQKI
jgi:hypothetical protein